eukprot:TRINITY_DN73772_c0_g1_i1.p1 TRINITY_DN73772_c0_g1~~TRINITY_DN73772_c0_g1_i1.p1  ORF type:complete len:599 (-),score=144.44 TRINITY_DN73772_c0_g1_i1:47-1843(-)
MAADQGSAGTAVGSQEPLERAKILNALASLLGSKPAEYCAEVQRRAAAGNLNIKGQQIPPELVREALQLSSGNPAPAPQPAGPQLAAGKRWMPTSSTVASLSAKALMECEDAEQFCEKIRVIGGNKVAVLPKPDVLSNPTGEIVVQGEWTEVVARVVSRRDGRVYLRLRNYTGWVSTRSRKEFSKVVLEGEESRPPLEPPTVQIMSRGRALRLLQPMTEGGRPLHAAPTPSLDGVQTAGPEPRMFRATGIVNILPRPDCAGIAVAGAKLNAKEEFLADGAYLRPEDGRAYLHLQDCRGWICERAKSDFSRLVIEPAGPLSDLDAADEFVEAAGVAQPLRARAKDGKKVIVVERSAEEAATSSATASAPADPNAVGTLPGGAAIDESLPAQLVLRSDMEIWPEELRPPRPLGKDLRVELRRLFSFYGVKLNECEEDVKQLQEKADAGAKGKKELLAYVDTLKKEMQKLKKEWTSAAKAVLVKLPAASFPAKSKQASPEPEPEPEQHIGGSIMPVQVRGSRWFCASLGGRSLEPDAAEEEQRGGTGLRHMGPLRSTREEASADLKQLLQAKASGAGSKRKGAEEKKDDGLKRARTGKLKE